MKNTEFLYEELRKATDGGSESMTHDDALKQISYWRDAVIELAALKQQEPVGEISRVGMASYGRPWHEINWYSKDVDVPHGSKLYLAAGAQSVPEGAIHKAYADMAFDALTGKPDTYYRSLKLIMDKAMLAAVPKEQP